VCMAISHFSADNKYKNTLLSSFHLPFISTLNLIIISNTKMRIILKNTKIGEICAQLAENA